MGKKVKTITRTLLAGAGAESDYGLSSGPEFTLDTFYSKNGMLYDALKKFYALEPGSKESPQLCSNYERRFLFGVNSPLFKKFLASSAQAITKEACPNDAFSEDPYGRFIKAVAGEVSRRLEGADTDNTGELRNLDAHLKRIEKKELIEKRKDVFNLLVVDKKMPAESKLIRDLCSKSLQEVANADIHYGYLEQYYSALIDPNEDKTTNSKQWTLINFYWSCYFAIVEPLLKTLGGSGKDALPKELKTKEDYFEVLDHLPELTKILWTHRFLENREQGDEKELHYYEALTGVFDYVMTTNYTPLILQVFPENGEGDNARLEGKVIRLSGSLAQFERRDTLTVDSLDQSLTGWKADRSLYFPFLMSQSPVKPMINTAQLRQYARALDALDKTDELVVLGYSFTKNDEHVVTIVREWLSGNGVRGPRTLVYLAYVGENTLEQKRKELEKCLRLDFDNLSYGNQVKVLKVVNAKSDAITELHNKHAVPIDWDELKFASHASQ